MSSRHLAWAMSLKAVKGTTRHVLLQLAYWADSKTGHVTRSHQQLAEETGYSVRTVQDALKELTLPGCVLIERKRRTSRRGRLADSYKILAVLPAKTAGRRGASQPAKSADRTGKNCRAYTREESNNHHPASPDGVAASHAAPCAPTSCSDSSRPPDDDCRQDGGAEIALRLAGFPSSPPLTLAVAQGTITFLVDEYRLPTVKTAMQRLRLRIDGGKKIKSPARILGLICEDIERERRQRRVNSYASHGISRFGG